MITEINPLSEINEAVALIQNTNIIDEIKRNHLQPQETGQVSNQITPTDFAVKFARLKKSLRKRSTNIF